MILFIIAAIAAVFAAVDIVTAKLLKIKRTLPRNISFLLVCVLATGMTVGGIVSTADSNKSDIKTLYVAYSFLLDGNTAKARENAAKIDSPHSDIIVMISDCMNGNYSGAFISSDDLMESSRLNEDLYQQVEKIYNLSRIMTNLDSNSELLESDAAVQVRKITKSCFELLNVSESSETEFLSGYSREKMLADNDYYEINESLLSEMLDETPNDIELLRYSVKYYNAHEDFDSAEENARKLLEKDQSVENIVLYTDVMAQKLMTDFDLLEASKDDEIAKYVKQAENAYDEAKNFDFDDPRYEACIAEAEEYKQKARGVQARRIINWLISRKPVFGDNTGLYDLQLSKLYCAAGDDDSAKKILLELTQNLDKIDNQSPIKSALEKMNTVLSNETLSDSDIQEAANSILYTDASLNDTVLNRGYSEFLNNMLKYERISIFVSKVDAADYPTVRIFLNVNGNKDGKEELASDFEIDDFTITDNGVEIPSLRIERIEDANINKKSIALVIDGSGSMEGTRIENAKKAVKACIDNMDPESQMLSIVIYENGGRIITPLTNDKDELLNGIDKIYANGGTIISSGIYSGIDSLKDADGSKAIILMTDGEDGSPETIGDAISMAQKENIAIFTVSTYGGDKEYMENIATQTGGTYMEATEEEELTKVYTSLQNYIVNNYCFEYTVTEGVKTNPRLMSVGLKEYSVSSSRRYSYGDLVLTKDDCYVVRSEQNTVSLLYASPSLIYTYQAEVGTPVFITGKGFEEGLKLFINGREEESVKVIDSETLAFTLEGAYTAGELEVMVRLPDGTEQRSSSLLKIASFSDLNTIQTVMLGNGNILHAGSIQQTDDNTLSLSDNINLNGFVYTDGTVALRSSTQITVSGNSYVCSEGVISGNSPAYINFTSNSQDDSYASVALNGKKIQVSDYFSFYFDSSMMTYSGYETRLYLPGFGTVYVDVVFDGEEFIYNNSYDASLDELQENLNIAFNGQKLGRDTANDYSDAIYTITGHNPNGYISYYNCGFYAYSSDLQITIGKNTARIKGSGTIGGYLGPIYVRDSLLTIDTDNISSMFEISGELDFYDYDEILGSDPEEPFTISSKGIYPDKLSVGSGSFFIDGDGFSSIFTDEDSDKVYDSNTDITIKTSYDIDDDDIKKKFPQLTANKTIKCDRIRFVYPEDGQNPSIILYSSSKPDDYIELTDYKDLIIPITGIDELSVFGSDLGGEIGGYAVISSYSMKLNITVDGHIDNRYYGIKYDGKGMLSVDVPFYSYGMNFCQVTLIYGRDTLDYSATVQGSIQVDNGFSSYELEDR